MRRGFWTFWLLLIGWMMLIFWLSSQNADESSLMSGGFTLHLFRLFSPRFAKMNIAAQQAIALSASFWIRKAAHFSLFSVLGMLAFASFAGIRALSRRRAVLFGWMLAVGYAVSDEIHQQFVSGRSCELRDVAIDSAGAMFGILLLTVLLFAVRTVCRKKRKENGHYA